MARSNTDNDAQIVRDLEQRIDTLQNMDDDSFGSFGALDWWILVIGALVLPIIAFVLAQ